ncbi:MAG: hypothetical protein FWH18_06580 [Marinilabiliaceae bacterium]|nr:hypothetical protein [Marinilabiliaceae bacterium]
MDSINFDLLINLESKIDRLVERYHTEKQANVMLRDEISRLAKQLEEAAISHSEVQKQFERLKMSKIISAASEDVQVTKTKINQLVKEIDKCIAMLNR